MKEITGNGLPEQKEVNHGSKFVMMLSAFMLSPLVVVGPWPCFSRACVPGAWLP